MIFDSGTGKTALTCGCGKVHYGISIGEESLVCSCGDILVFQEGEGYYDYYWVKKRLSTMQVENAINQDKRNLC